MDLKYKKIIQHLLNKKSTVKAQKLAELLGVSNRSIKTYVKQINDLYDELILSNRDGYLINAKKTRSILENELINESLIPQNYEERTHYIIKELIDEKSIDLNDLSEDIFVSTQTLINDISKMNKEFEKYHVKFKVNKMILSIDGAERSKRRLIARVIKDEAFSSTFDIAFIKKQFYEYDVDGISDGIRDIFNENGFYLNDFNYSNLILHVLIILSRNEFYDDKLSIDVDKNIVMLTDKIILFLQGAVKMQISQNSRTQLEVLFACHSINPEKMMNSNNIKESNNISNLVNKIIEHIELTYGVYLSNDLFVFPFKLHIANLYCRIKNDIHIENPLGDGIRRNCPIIYEIAIECAFELSKEWGFSLNEDEVTYIALHIGGEIQRQQDEKDKQPVAIISKDYHGLREWAYNELLSNFGTRVKFCGFYNNVEEVKNEKVLCLSLNDDYNSRFENVICINAFGTLPNLEIVYKLDEMDRMKKIKVLKDSFNALFNEKLFMIINDRDYLSVLKKWQIH